MANSLKTDSIASLASASEPADTDLFPIATNNGNTMNAALTSAVDGMSITFRAKKVNGLVFGSISFNTKTASLTAWTSRVLCSTGTIPENLQPSENQQIFVTQQNGGGQMVILKGGGVTYIPWVTMSNNMMAGAQFVYIGK